MRSLYEIDQLDFSDSCRSDILDLVKKNHYVVIRGLFDEELVRSRLDSIWTYALEGNHLGTSNVPKESIRQFSSKWSIGGESPIQADIARFMLTIYCPLSRTDTFEIHSWFRTLIEVRDLCAGRDKPYFDDDLPQPFFNGSRLQLYPSGGGFMSAHRDSTAVSTFNAASDGLFLQPLLLLTQRGKDFVSGGAFYVDSEGKRHFIEDGTLSGDIVVYDETIVHGVGDVDSNLPLDLGSRRGRIVALTTIYK